MYTLFCVTTIDACTLLIALNIVEKAFTISLRTSTILAVTSLEVSSITYLRGKGLLIPIHESNHHLEPTILILLVIPTVYALTTIPTCHSIAETVTIEL